MKSMKQERIFLNANSVTNDRRKILAQYALGLHMLALVAIACGKSGGSENPSPAVLGTAPLSNFKAFVNPTDVALSWQYNKEGDKVKITRRTTGYPASPGDGTLVYQGSATQFTDTSLATGKYYYAAFATNSAGDTVTESKRLTAFVRNTASTNGALYKVPVLDIRLFPYDNQVVFLDAPPRNTLAQKRSYVDATMNGLMNNLKDASTHVRDASTIPSLDYQPVVSYELMDIPATSAAFSGKVDYISILNNLDICTYVDIYGVRDVWMWTGASTQVPGTDESNMAMGKNASALWNRGTYGDISNSTQTNDLPVCNNTYVLYGFNFGRELATMIHNYGHQLERLFMFYDNALFTNFSQPYGPTAGTKHCGWVHFPPNGASDYNYGNTTTVTTSCSAWDPASESVTETLNCSTWNCDHEKFLVWWMKRLPGNGSPVTHNTETLRNIWYPLADFDNASRASMNMTLPGYALPEITNVAFSWQCLNCEVYSSGLRSVLNVSMNFSDPGGLIATDLSNFRYGVVTADGAYYAALKPGSLNKTGTSSGTITYQYYYNFPAANNVTHDIYANLPNNRTNFKRRIVITKPAGAN